MNYNKIGEFIATERKAKNLTQVKLAEKLFISEKTISKWENGNGVPDAKSLTLLCEVFNVSLNELLSGERIKNNKTNNTEQLLLDMAKEIKDKNKVIFTCMCVIMAVSIVAMFGGMLMAAYLINNEVIKLIIVIASAVVFLIPCFYALKLEVSVGAYKCKKCGTEIIPTYTEALSAMHLGFTRYLKCPHCKKRTWCKKVINKKEEQ